MPGAKLRAEIQVRTLLQHAWASFGHDRVYKSPFAVPRRWRRDAVVRAFGDMYRNASGEFPSGVAERDYLERMKGCYPIHPELFERLYQDWSTLDRFQRTRGVLRLMDGHVGLDRDGVGL